MPKPMENEKELEKFQTAPNNGNLCAEDMMGVKLTTNSCMDNCENRQCCDNCSRQLCQQVEFQVNLRIEKTCQNEGYYSTSEAFPFLVPYRIRVFQTFI